MSVEAPPAVEPVFRILDVEPVPYAAAPMLRFQAHVEDPLGRDIHTIALTTQIQIDPARRAYDPETMARLVELFGEPERWASTTQIFRWANVSALVSGFTGATSFELEVPVTYDLEVAASKYFYSLEDGEVPLSFLFNGMVLYRGEQDRLQVSQVPWSCVTRWRMPVEAFRRVIAAHYPGGGWVRVETETLDRLAERKAAGGHHSFDGLIRELLG